MTEPIDKTVRTETVSAEEIVQLCNHVGLNSENITPEEVTDWLECETIDGGFEILNYDEIVFYCEYHWRNEIDDEPIINQKLTTSHSGGATKVHRMA